MKWDDFYTKLLNVGPDANLKINNQDYQIKFIASYFTEHFPNEEYIKVFLSDNAVLQVVPNAKELYFCNDPRRELDRNLITDNGQTLTIDGKKYSLENGEDKQFIKTIYFGNLSDGEGECIFSDYSGGDEVWSLATLANGEISDIHVEKIDLDKVYL